MVFSRNLAGLLILFAAALGAQDARSDQITGGVRLADPEVLEALRATDTPGLPKNLAPGERPYLRLPDLSTVPRDAPVADRLRTFSEYEHNEAIVMRWGNFNAELTEMIVPITNDDGLANVMLVVANSSQQTSAFNTLNSAGADMSRVEFVIAPSDSVWIRDYGPRFSSADNLRVIIDHEYNRSFRPLDNQIPSAIAAYLGEDIYDMPIRHGGGNFHLFSNGEAFMTSLILNENPGYTEQDVIDLYADYQGVDLTILDPLPQSFDSTQHLDMWFLPVDDQTVIIGEYDENEFNGIPYQVTENTATMMQSRGYTVLRTPGWRSGAHYTYTNSVIVNDLVLICQFNGYGTQNAQALAVYETAFPDKTIVQVNCSSIISQAGAIHCIVMHKPLKATFTVDLEPQAASVCVPEVGFEEVTVDVAVGSINEYEGTVALSASGVPSGVSSGLDSDEVIGPGAALWTLTVNGTAPAGSFPITLTGDDGLESKQTEFALTLDEPLSGPGLQTPPDQAHDVDFQPEFTWDELTGATDYRIQVALDPGFAQVVIDEWVDSAPFIPQDELDSGTVYYWRVQAQNSCGSGDWSGAREFLTRFQPVTGVTPASFAFEVPQGGADTGTLIITNAGNGELAWNIAAEACSDGVPALWLSVDPDSGSTPEGDPAEVLVAVDAAGMDAGEYAGGLCLTANDENNPQVSIPVVLTVIELPPGEMEVTPAVLDFGDVATGGGAVLTVTVSNVAAVGSADLALTPPQIIVGQGVFTIDAAGGDCGETLAPQTNCTVAVNYSPQTVAAHNGILRIGAEDVPAVNVNLSGNGIDPAPTIFEDRFEDQ